MADIRRPTADINPVNYIQPGVTDNSTATLISGATELGAAGFELDKRLAKKRFGEALETLRTQAITDQAPDSGDPDPDVGEALAGVDKSSLRDFEKVLSQQDGAVNQGRMSREQFRIRAERLYRVAISKRPGLANEFRQVASNYLGMDVVGATVDEIFRLREEEQAAEAAKSKTAYEQLVEHHTNVRERWEEIGVPGAEYIIPGTAQASEFIANNMPKATQIQAEGTAVANAKAAQELAEANNSVNSEIYHNSYNASVTALVTDFSNHMERRIAALHSAGQADDVNAVEATLIGLINEYDEGALQLEAMYAGKLDPAFMSAQRERGTYIKDRLKLILSGERNAEWTKNALATTSNLVKMNFMSKPQLASVVVLGDMFTPQTLEFLLKGQLPAVQVAIAERVQERGKPEDGVSTGPAVVRSLIKAVWPRPNAQPKPEDVNAATKGISRTLTSFYLVDSPDFKPGNFTKAGTKEGVLTYLNDHHKTIVPTLSDAQREELTTTMGGAAANSVRILTQRLFAKAPGIREKLDPKMFTPDSKGRIYRAKGTVPLTKLEQAAVEEFNSQANVKLITETMQKYSGMKTQQEVWKYIAAMYPDVQAAKEQRAATNQLEAERGELEGSSTLWWRAKLK